MLRGVIFDLDGTLGDTLPVCYRAFASVFARRLGRQYSDGEIHAMFGPSEEGILARLCPDDPVGALEEYLAEYRQAHASCPQPFEGVPELLEALRERGIELAIVTGKGPHSARISLEAFGLDRFFAPVEAGSAEGGIKPDAMRSVLNAWGIEPGEAAGVGDSPSDVGAAKQVGIDSVAAAWAPGAVRERLAASEPDCLCDSLPELRAWLDRRLAGAR